MCFLDLFYRTLSIFEDFNFSLDVLLYMEDFKKKNCSSILFFFIPSLLPNPYKKYESDNQEAPP
jgi:hypothetical protein